MEIMITAAGLAVLLFLCAFLGFRQGLRLGMQAAKGQVPKKIDPVGSVKQAVEGSKDKKHKADMLKGYQEMMQFNGEPKKGV